MGKNEQKSSGTYLISWPALRSDWPLWVLIAAMFVAGAWLYPQLPEQMPSHWNYRGEIDATMAKPWGVFMTPLMTVGIYLMLWLLPFIDPRRENYPKFAGTYRLFRFLLVLFFTGLYSVLLMAGLGYPVPVDRLIQGGIGLLFAIMGNSMGRLRHNWFVGIKTPWALADEEVWRATHRVGGKLWAAGGLVAFLAAFLPTAVMGPIGFGAIGVSAVASMVYSYVAWVQKKKGERH